MGRLKQRDIIYMNKEPEEGIRELREAGRKFKLTYSYAVLFFGLAVFSFV